MNRLFAVVFLATVVAWSWPAHAATVSILLPTAPSAEVSEALNLLRGELLSLGLAVTTEQYPADHDQRGPDSRRWLEDLAARGSSAIIDTVEAEAGLALDVWVVRSNPLRFEVTRAAVEASTPKAAEVLALRAVEALRAGFLLVDRASRKQILVVDSPPEVVTTNKDLREPRERWGVEAGVAALTSFDGVGLAFLPMGRVGWAPHPSLVVQASLLGEGTRPKVTMAGATVRVAQQYGTLGVCYRLRAGQRFWPFFALASGAMHTTAEGQSDADDQGRTVGRWSWIADGSFGAGLRIHGRTYASLAVHVQWARPYLVIHGADDASTSSTGRPNLALTLTLGAWL